MSISSPGGQDPLQQIQQQELMKRLIGGQAGQGLGQIGSGGAGGSTMGNMAKQLGGVLPGPVGMGMNMLGDAGNKLSDMATAPAMGIANAMRGAGGAISGLGQSAGGGSDMAKMLKDQIAGMGSKPSIGAGLPPAGQISSQAGSGLSESASQGTTPPQPSGPPGGHGPMMDGPGPAISQPMQHSVQQQQTSQTGDIAHDLGPGQSGPNAGSLDNLLAERRRRQGISAFNSGLGGQ